MSRLARLTIALAVAFAAAFGLSAATAWGPPAVGEPSIGISVRCAPYGTSFTVTGGNFQPGSQVRISNPAGHYTGPLTPYAAIAPVTVTPDADGTLRARLHVSSAPKTYLAEYRAATIWIDGPSRIGGERITVFSGVVVASRATCRALDHPAKPKR